MDSILPLDVFTHIIGHVNHESLLALRLTCRNIKELVSPLLFASIRVVCSAEDLQRLDDLAEKSLELSRLVLDLTVDCIPQVNGEGEPLICMGNPKCYIQVDVNIPSSQTFW